MRRRLLTLFLAMCLVIGCAPSGAGDAVTAKISAFNDAKIDKLIEAKIADKIAVVVEAKAEAKIAEKIDKIEANLNANMDVKIGEFRGKQTIGMFAGGGLYVLLLALSLVAAVAGVFIYMIRHRDTQLKKQTDDVERKALLISAITSAVSRVRKRHEEGNDDVESVVDEIKNHAEKAGVLDDLNRILVSHGLL